MEEVGALGCDMDGLDVTGVPHCYKLVEIEAHFATHISELTCR